VSQVRTVAIVSGGLDSVVLASYLKASGQQLHLLSIDYGQRHLKEIEFAQHAADALSSQHSVVDLRSIVNLISSSALTGDIEVPDGAYEEESMRQTVVPNRNMMMLSVASAVAISENADYVAIGVHGGDHFIYPDCRPEFIRSCSDSTLLGMEGVSERFKGIVAPFAEHDKAWIVTLGESLGVPWGDTWSCYRGGEIHCGRCGTCVERLEAFSQSGVEDPSRYQDAEFWRTLASTRPRESL
jgi:7-cyano-7-deazaguanine synthase